MGISIQECLPHIARRERLEREILKEKVEAFFKYRLQSGPDVLTPGMRSFKYKPFVKGLTDNRLPTILTNPKEVTK